MLTPCPDFPPREFLAVLFTSATFVESSASLGVGFAGVSLSISRPSLGSSFLAERLSARRLALLSRTAVEFLRSSPSISGLFLQLVVWGTPRFSLCCFVRRVLLFAESAEVSEVVGMWRFVGVTMPSADWCLRHGRIRIGFPFAAVLHRDRLSCSVCSVSRILVVSNGLGKNRPSLSSR